MYSKGTGTPRPPGWAIRLTNWASRDALTLADSAAADVAVALEQVLGTSAELWLQLEATRQAHDAREEQERSLAGFSSWAAKFTRAVLIERGVIDRGDRGPDAVRKLLRFFEVVSPKAFDKTWLEPMASFKRSQVLDIDPDLSCRSSVPSR